MKRMWLGGAALALMAVAGVADPAILTFSGEASLGEEICAGGVKAPDCVMSLTITGPAAKTLYQGMREKVKHDECVGADVKEDGKALYCYHLEADSYSCNFGYSFKNKKFQASPEDC